jgi:hypothetical protein
VRERVTVKVIDADDLGGDKPKTMLEGPTPALHADKLEFEASRRARWFKPS